MYMTGHLWELLLRHPFLCAPVDQHISYMWVANINTALIRGFIRLEHFKAAHCALTHTPTVTRRTLDMSRIFSWKCAWMRTSSSVIVCVVCGLVRPDNATMPPAPSPIKNASCHITIERGRYVATGGPDQVCVFVCVHVCLRD